uniref:DUF6527 family protein n=1 Tax=uncultured Draconibacterium sp. TaxID=1573823 RepID=UPI003216D327
MTALRPEFVEYLPKELEEGILYISMKYKTAGHKCPCGCGNLVFTPFSPIDWQISYNGKGVTLTPSIGNWDYECRSHYWIMENEIQYAREFDSSEIEYIRRMDVKDKEQFFKKRKRRNFRNWLFKVLMFS